MNALFKRAKRILSLVLVLGLLLTSIAPGMVPQVWAASTSITAGEIVAKNYELTAAEKALLKSGYLVGNTIEYTEPADCVAVDMNAKTITAFEKDGWVPTVAKIMVGGETVETLNMVPGEAVTYEHAGQVFEVVVTYELTTTEISEETQELLLNAAGTLQEGLDNLKEAYKADTNLGTVALAMDILVELANGITMDFGGFQVSGKFETDAAITAVNALKAQSDSNNGKLNLQIINEEYNAADSKVQYLNENGQQYFETLKNTYENLAALKEDGLLNNSILDAYLQNSDPAGHTQWMAFKNILGNLVGALKPYADRDAWVILDENPLAANVDYEELDDLVNGITGLTDVSGLELKDVLDVAEAEVLVSQNMKKVTVNVTLKVVGKNNQYKEYTYTKEFNAKEGIEIDEVVAEIETRGIEEDAIEDWGSKYVAGQYVAKVENEDELPETLDADLEYNIVYSPKEYDVTLKYNNNAVMSYPYGYMYELEAHSNSEKAYDYKVNGVYQPQGTVLKIEEDLEIDRTVGRAYETTDLLTVIAQNFGNDKETAILTSKALKGNVKLPIRHPNSEDASTLLSIEGTTLTAETYPSNYEGLEWIPYEYSYVNGGAEGAKHYFDGATSVELTETYDSIFVTYILRLTNFDAEDDVKPWIELTGTLSEEAADQKAALDRLGSYSGQMGQLDKTKLGALNGVIDVTDLHSDPAKNAQLKADFKEAVGNIIDNNLGTNNLLKIKNILDEYNEGGLKYYYKNSAKVLDEINSLSSQLTALLADEEKEAALGVLVGAAGYPEYAEKIKDLESAMTTVKADLKAPNAAIDIEAGSIDALVDALTMAGTAGNSAADTPYLYEEGPFVIEAEGISTVKFNVVIDGSAPYTVYPLQGAEDYVVTQGDIDYVNGLIESYVGGKIEVEFYNSDYSETSLDALVGKALNEIGTQTFTWTPKTYTVVIDGEMNQTISVNDRSVDLFAHAESGYYYNYFIDGISKKVEEDTDYTFTVDQIRRLFTNGSYEIVREEVNVGEKTFNDWLHNLNTTIGRTAFTMTDGGTTLKGQIGMSDMMNMVMGMMNGYSYIGLNNEGLLYMNDENATEVSLQTLVNAMLSDENFTEQTLIDLADHNGGTLVTTTIQLGDDDANIAKDLTFVINLTSVPSQMDTVAGLLKTLKGYMEFQAVDGTLAVTAEMPEEFYDIYLTALTLTGKVDLTDLNAVETAVSYEFLADYVKVLTGEDVDATTYVNTLKKLGKEDLLAGYETYINELLGMLGNSFTYDEENENYALSLTASKELLEKVLAAFGGDNLGSVTGLIKEMKDGGALIIPLTAEVTNFNDDNAAQDKYEAFIVNQGALNQGGLDKLEVVNISTNLAADLVNSSGFNVVILQKDLGTEENPVNLVINAGTNAYLDLNGKIITGTVTVNGQLTLIDSTFDTANAGGIDGELSGNNISVIAGRYTANVEQWLKSGYVQAEGAADELKAVSNELYTMAKYMPMAMRRAARTPNEIVTVTLNTDLLQNRQDLNKSMAKAVAVDLVSDLLMNFYTAASLSFGTDMDIYDIDDAELTTLLQWYADGITEIDAVNKALDCLNEEGLKNFINQVIADMTDFETIAEGEVISSYDISSKCWTIVVEQQPDNSFDGGIAANPDMTKALTLNIEIAGEKEEVITDLAAELAEIVTSDIAIDEIADMNYDGTNVNIGGKGHADVVVDMSGNHDYAAIIGIALAYSNVANKAEFVEALDDYFENGLTEKLEAAFDKATVADVIKALKALNMDTDLAEMIDAIGLADVADNSDEKTAELEAVYHPFLVAAGYILDYLDITGPSTKMSALKNDDKYVADKENIGREGTYTVAKGKGVAYDLEMTKIALTVKLFTDADTATIEVKGIENLKYSGKDQELVKLVDCYNGTPMYSLDGENWSEEIPTGKEVGEYTVYYYADGNKGFKDSEIKSVIVEIANKTTNKPSKPSLNKKDHVEIFSGYPDETFRPKKAMTRAEVAVVFSKLMKPAMVEGKTYTTNFSDVEAGKWYSNAIGFMVEEGILSGYTDGTFRPNQEITRAEFATIATKFEELTVGGDHKFSDVPETNWAYTFINFAAERGYVSGYSDGTFRPGNSITREEVATVLCKVLEREADKAYINAHEDEVNNFSDVKKTDWSYWFIMEATNVHEYTKSNKVETWTDIK